MTMLHFGLVSVACVAGVTLSRIVGAQQSARDDLLLEWRFAGAENLLGRIEVHFTAQGKATLAEVLEREFTHCPRYRPRSRDGQ